MTKYPNKNKNFSFKYRTRVTSAWAAITRRGRVLCYGVTKAMAMNDGMAYDDYWGVVKVEVAYLMNYIEKDEFWSDD